MLLGGFKKKLFAGREKTDDVWIGGGGSGGSGEYDCAHQTALYMRVIERAFQSLPLFRPSDF